MKLTLVACGDLRVGRGTENVIFNIIKYKPDGIDISIISSDYTGGNPLILSNDEVNKLTNNCKTMKFNVKSFNAKNSSKISMAFRELIYKPVIRTFKSIPEHLLIQMRETEVVYLFCNQYSIFFNGMNIPIIGSNHLTDLGMYDAEHKFFVGIYYKLLFKRYYKHINGIHVFPYRHHLLTTSKLKYTMNLANGIDTSLFYPDYENNIKLKFLFVASLRNEKGLDILLPLIEKINSPNVEFHIAGGGPLADEIKNNKKIVYHGILSDSALSKLYRECDVFIYPTHFDAFPLVTLQALSSGLYVMCSDYLKGNFDWFDNKYLEYLPLNFDIWYNRVKQIIDNKSILNHDKKEEYNYVKNNYDWSIISKKFYDYMIEFYNESKGLTL